MRASSIVLFLGVILSLMLTSSSFTISKRIFSQLADSKKFRRLFATSSHEESLEASDDFSRAPTISWYPGHIAKAERELSEYIKKVDVVIEVRDARIPIATTHPMVPRWVGNKPLIVAIARLDQISHAALTNWREFYAMVPAHPERPDAKVFFIDGKKGSGVIQLKREALKAGAAINEKRKKRGIQPRAVRAAVIGFPNVGKSALINRLLGRKMAVSRNLPGVTKALRWVRLGGDAGASGTNLELLDSPGIIPAKQFDQKGAYLLAMCNDIGEASYDRVLVATALCDQINLLHASYPEYVDMDHIIKRYNIPYDEMNGEEILYAVATNTYKGNMISAADKVLGDFRKGLLRFGSLEAADLQMTRSLQERRSDEEVDERGDVDERVVVDQEETITDIVRDNQKPASRNQHYVTDIGKGNYEGW